MKAERHIPERVRVPWPREMPQKNWKRTSVKGQSSRRELDSFQHAFGCFAEGSNSMKYRRLKQGYSYAVWEAFPREVNAVSLALEELVTSTIKYGYYDPG